MAIRTLSYGTEIVQAIRIQYYNENNMFLNIVPHVKKKQQTQAIHCNREKLWKWNCVGSDPGIIHIGKHCYM